LDEIQKYADYIIIIKAGVILYTGSAQGQDLYKIYGQYINSDKESNVSSPTTVSIDNIFGK
jgi:ABC-type multidrug transport system ATPase subunit